jgi:hypothetical protein
VIQLYPNDWNLVFIRVLLTVAFLFPRKLCPLRCVHFSSYIPVVTHRQGLTTLGALSVTLTDATLPKGLPFHLNTNDTILSLAYPALHTRYPTGLPVELQIFAATQPVVSFGMRVCLKL